MFWLKMFIMMEVRKISKNMCSPNYGRKKTQLRFFVPPPPKFPMRLRFFASDDDAIAVKSGINYLGRTFGRTSENITIRNMTVGNSQGLSVGSEVSGGARNITFQNIFMNGTVYGPHVKSLRSRGGLILILFLIFYITFWAKIIKMTFLSTKRIFGNRT
jgi:hypothetical protein